MSETENSTNTPPTTEDVAPGDIPLKKKEGVTWQGNIAFTGEIRGHYAGCKAIQFLTAQEMNEFFEKTQNVIVAGIFPGGSSWLVLYTTALTDNEIADLDAWGREQNAFMAERRAAREKDREEYLKAERAEAAEKARLSEVGKKCEQNHSKAIEAKRAEKKAKK